MARLHPSDGKFVGWKQLPNFFVSFSQAVRRKTTGHIPRQPWIPFSARRALEAVITPGFNVWEVGAGYSTLWLSDRVAHVVSVEAAKPWFELLQETIAREQIENVDLRFEWQAERMADFSELTENSIDLLLIDGGPRGLCLEHGFSKVRAGGYLYLDNWDTKEFWCESVDFPTRNSAMISESHSFVDFVSAQVGVYEGLLLKKAGSKPI